MRYLDFEEIMSAPRMNRYLDACGGDSRKAMTLYRLNLKLSQQLFTIISCFEIALRNKINNHYTVTIGSNWLAESTKTTGVFNDSKCKRTKQIVNKGIKAVSHHFNQHKLIAEMDFGDIYLQNLNLMLVVRRY
ncbi:Abi family protein [Flavobacterium sp.]|jgi:hypothetical protein|uniref:Abi family protein n=1 Tax=Flavobacterium sp. TaxID=239 RepID=UPI0022C862A0|nr:Abi family protein [Flavobacterium sp.]MCZ8146125.1 Abi family protein [Flavobacterium sp.]MCZ8366881.1 Abi family protein [Flavobacterium sp.]